MYMWGFWEFWPHISDVTYRCYLFIDLIIDSYTIKLRIIMQVLPELLRVLNFEFLKTQVIIESKQKQEEPIDQDVVACVELGSDIL